MAELATMNLSKRHTKSSMVAKSIAQNIHSGVLKPGTRLQTVRSLSDKFSVSISVIQAALRELEEKKLIERKANSVALIRESTDLFQNAEKQVMLCIESSGHIYGEVSGLISNELVSRGFLPVTVDHSKMAQTNPDQKFKKNVKAILDSGLKSVILSGLNYWHYPFLEDHSEFRAVFLYAVDYAGKMPERAVLYDVEDAIYQTTAHLASLGRKKIMLCTFNKDPHSINTETMHRHHSTQILSGYKRALREYNVASYDEVFYRLSNDKLEVNEQKLTDILSSKDAPDAIVCDMDHTAMQVEMTAIKNGLKVPDDLAVTGVYNTPWSEFSPVPLTTVSYDNKELAKMAIKLSLEDEPEQKIYYMKPKLIIKESTGGTK